MNCYNTDDAMSGVHCIFNFVTLINECMTSETTLSFFQVAVTVLAVMNGNINRLLYGYDCFGNTCNSPNAKILENETMNGLDMTGKP